MKPAAKAVWHRFSEPLEGRCYHMYLDQKGLVTTGVGNLIDDVRSATAMPWKRPSGDPATRDEIIAAWALVRSKQEWAPIGGNNRRWHELTALRLTPDDVDAIVDRHLASDEAHLRRFFPDYDHWPADAHLAIHSWAWAVGPAASYPKMFVALMDRDFELAASECTINPQVGTIVERNKRNRVLLKNAARVQAFHFDPDALYWPDTLDAAVREATTQPELAAVEEDGGASRRGATLDTVADLAREELDE